MHLKSIIGENLYFKLQNAEWEGRKQMSYLSEYVYNKFKGKLTESSYSWDDFIQMTLDKIPSKENHFRTTITQIHEIVKNHPEHIPEGTYCYDKHTCPYWASNPFAGDQGSGICIFLNEYDSDEPGIPLLWDQVKSCGINEGDFE